MKMRSELGENYIYGQEHQLYYYYNNFERKLLNKKNWKKTVQRFTLSQTMHTLWLDQQTKMYSTPVNLSL